MSRTLQRLTFLLFFVGSFGLASCSGEIGRDECIANYAHKGSTDQIVRWGYELCDVATDANLSAKDRDDALCAVKKIPSTPSELAFKQVVGECYGN
jgi:hypothetical protein